MNMRGARRRRAADRGFVLSITLDWDGLNWAIKETGRSTFMSRMGTPKYSADGCVSRGYDAHIVETRFNSEDGEEDEEKLVKAEKPYRADVGSCLNRQHFYLVPH